MKMSDAWAEITWSLAFRVVGSFTEYRQDVVGFEEHCKAFDYDIQTCDIRRHF
jgi:hypothetical protein